MWWEPLIRKSKPKLFNKAMTSMKTKLASDRPPNTLNIVFFPNPIGGGLLFCHAPCQAGQDPLHTYNFLYWSRQSEIGKREP